jgi:hypothetical protein
MIWHEVALATASARPVGRAQRDRRSPGRSRTFRRPQVLTLESDPEPTCNFLLPRHWTSPHRRDRRWAEVRKVDRDRVVDREMSPARSLDARVVFATGEVRGPCNSTSSFRAIDTTPRSASGSRAIDAFAPAVSRSSLAPNPVTGGRIGRGAGRNLRTRDSNVAQNGRDPRLSDAFQVAGRIRYSRSVDNRPAGQVTRPGSDPDGSAPWRDDDAARKMPSSQGTVGPARTFAKCIRRSVSLD